MKKLYLKKLSHNFYTHKILNNKTPKVFITTVQYSYLGGQLTGTLSISLAEYQLILLILFFSPIILSITYRQ